MKNFTLIASLLMLSVGSIGQQTVGIFQNDSTSLNGYTLFAPLYSNETFLVDNCGELVNKWSASPYTPGPAVYLLEDGSLLKTGKITTGSIITGGSGGQLEIYNWNDSLTWSYTFDSPTERQHHDVTPLPNGNILVLSWDVKSRNDAVAAGLDLTHYDGELWSEKITEIKPIGSDSLAVIWEWYLWDHLVQDIDNTKPNFGAIQHNPQKVDLNYFNNNGISKDYFHINGLDYHPDLDQIILSVRNYDEFWIIDHSTTTAQAATSSGGKSGKGGDLLYRWGNPEAYGRGDINDKKLFGPHNPNWIKKGYRDEGKIMVFNNGLNRTNQISTVEIIAPTIDTSMNYKLLPDNTFAPAQPDWIYQMPVFVDFVSGASRLSNGNTFITSGPDAHFYELDNQDQVVWDYVSPADRNNTYVSQGDLPIANSVFKAIRYAEDYSAFTNRTITSQGPLELNPTPTNCVIYGKTIVGIDEKLESVFEVQVIQNPIADQLRIENKTNAMVNIQVIDLLGRELVNLETADQLITIPASNWKKQMYVVVVRQNNQVLQQKIIKR